MSECICPPNGFQFTRWKRNNGQFAVNYAIFAGSAIIGGIAVISSGPLGLAAIGISVNSLILDAVFDGICQCNPCNCVP